MQEIKQSSIPPTVRARLFDFTGNSKLGRGFMLVHTDSNGDISVVMEAETAAISAALMAKAGVFLDKMNEQNFS